MNTSLPHSWNVTPSQAIKIQEELRHRIVLRDSFGEINTIAGVDVGFDKSTNHGRAAVVVLRLEDLTPIDTAFAEKALAFPYVPGLLSFREIPVILQALQKLTATPDLLLCDGQGTAHPRRFGIACHLGILTDIPAIGVAKTRLVGDHAEVPANKGGWTELLHKGDIIGAVLRSREKVKPIYISPGHRISLQSAIRYTMRAVTKYRLPETTRQAHKFSLFSQKADR